VNEAENGWNAAESCEVRAVCVAVQTMDILCMHARQANSSKNSVGQRLVTMEQTGKSPTARNRVCASQTIGCRDFASGREAMLSKHVPSCWLGRPTRTSFTRPRRVKAVRQPNCTSSLPCSSRRCGQPSSSGHLSRPISYSQSEIGSTNARSCEKNGLKRNKTWKLASTHFSRTR